MHRETTRGSLRHLQTCPFSRSSCAFFIVKANSSSDISRKMIRWASAALVVALLAAGLMATVHHFWPEGKAKISSVAALTPARVRGGTNPDPSPAMAQADAQNSQPSEAFDRPFRAWLSEYSSLLTGSQERDKILPAGIELAKARRPLMEKLLREDPRRAVTEALSFGEWDALPDEIKAEVERPFSVSADYTYYPICREPGAQLQPGEPTFIATLSMPDGLSLQTFSYGRREEVMSKRALPVQGVALAGLAAMRDGALQIVDPADLATVRTLFSDGQKAMTRSLTSGNQVDGSAVYALAGGRLYAFASHEEAQALDSKLAELDALPGPFAASSLLAASADMSVGGNLNLPKIQAQALAQSSSWTESKKRLFLIRINFTDKPEEPVTKAAAEAEMTRASDRIREISYGKTWVEATASTNLYTMPKSFAYYSEGNVNDRFFTELMRDARNTFRRQKSGADAGVDIGPESNLHEGGEAGFGDYDIVGIFRTNLPGEGGVAGGPSLFMMANYERIYTHEWGHNYGLHHSSLWKTTDGSVDGEAATVDEYGDPFDIMGHGPTPEGHFRPEGKAYLNWLGAAEWEDININLTGSKTYRIYKIDDPAVTSNPRGIRVERGGNGAQNGFYWVGYRGAFSSNPRLSNGAYLTAQRPGQARSLLLDTTPDSIGGTDDSALAMGATFSAPDSSVHVTLVGKGGSGSGSYIDVRVNLGPFPQNSPPQASPISGPSTIQARKPATYSVSGSDPDSDALAYSWDAGGRTPVEGSNSPMLQSQWITGGTHEIKVTVSDMKGGRVNRTSQVQVADPLDNWSSTSVGRSVTLVGAQGSNGMVIAVGYWGELFHSWDGITWTESQNATGINQNPRLAFGDGKFVLVGRKDGEQTARIALSRDGRLWSAAAVPAGVAYPRAVGFGGGRFVAVGDSGSVLWSIDGLAWNSATVPGAPDFRELAWNGSGWLATAINPDNGSAEVAWTSVDGLTWTKRDLLGAYAGSIIAHKGAFLVMGWYNGIKRSTDNGITWSSAIMPAGVQSWSARQVAVADDGTLFAYGLVMDVSGHPPVPLVSIDGLSWHWSTSVGAADALKDTGWDQIAFGAGRFIRVGSNGVVKYSQPLSVGNSAPVVSANHVAGSGAREVVSLSANATDPEGDALRYYWDFGPQMPGLQGNNAKIILPFGGSYNVTLLVVDAKGAVSTTNQTVTFQDPALNFTARSSGATYALQSIAANDSVAVAVGDANHPILTSIDGVSWTKRTLPTWTYLQDIVWDGSKFFVTGHSWRSSGGVAQWHNVVHTSPDGVAWTERYAGVAGLRLVRKLAAKPGGPAIAGGDQGFFMRSPDGLNWSELNIPEIGTSSVKALAWSGKEFLMLTDHATAKLLTSTDGSQWTDRSYGIGLDATWKSLSRVFWLNDRFVASGWYSNIRTSTNGGQNFAATRMAGNVELPAMAYGSGIYFGAGWDLANSSQDVDVFSLNGEDWYPFVAGTTNDRTGATFFKNTFITVDRGGEIRQSGPVAPADDVLALDSIGSVSWDGANSEVRHKFLGLPGRQKLLQFSPDLSMPWQTQGVVEAGPLGVFEAAFRQSGDQRAKWGKGMFFRLLPTVNK